MGINGTGEWKTKPQLNVFLSLSRLRRGEWKLCAIIKSRTVSFIKRRSWISHTTATAVVSQYFSVWLHQTRNSTFHFQSHRGGERALDANTSDWSKHRSFAPDFTSLPLCSEIPFTLRDILIKTMEVKSAGRKGKQTQSQIISTPLVCVAEKFHKFHFCVDGKRLSHTSFHNGFWCREKQRLRSCHSQK